MKRYIPLLVLVFTAAAVGYAFFFQPSPKSAFNLAGFSNLPVLANGRIKPMDTVARNALLVFQGKQSISSGNGDRLTPIEWLLDVFYRADVADHYQHFKIVNPDVLAVFGLRPEDGADNKRFSFLQFQKGIDELDRQAKLAEAVESQLRSPFQKAIVELETNVFSYQRLKYSMITPDSPDFLAELTQVQENMPRGVEAARAKQAGKPADDDVLKLLMEADRHFELMAGAASLLPVPPADPSNALGWINVGQALIQTFRQGQIDVSALTYAGLGHAWRLRQPEQFNKILQLFQADLAKRFPSQLYKANVETRFNVAAPFFVGLFLYVVVFLGGVISWLKWPDIMGRSAFYLLGLAWVVTTVGILARMWLEGRPPVTNLYSSALYVGWVAGLLCIILEAIYRNAIGTVAGGMIGVCTLLIAHHLSLLGDTLEMMRAVLDSNFWLSTHVISVTTGYGATFLAGFLAIIYVVRGVYTKSLDKATADTLNRMVYGIVCFATLFSLVGTVLGGIWADQSWGRFWGWDPKENGALIIVLWNAIFLHSRWGGLVKARGLMALAVFGNIVTSWSWFGVNMLGIGLHSYGFMDAAFWWLIAFVVSQLAIIAMALTPTQKWRSFLNLKGPSAPGRSGSALKTKAAAAAAS